ncbi:MAG: HPr-rel-A system PqqD family peptide chaperone [Rhodocyclaceae bacterium]|nr:HPr-rel-A system PqqD family peptide chaperone [Rhodocyclaceae bacterium]
MRSSSRFSLRQLGDGIAVFDRSNWQTRVLPPAGAVIVELLGECGEGATERQLCERIKSELDVSPDTPSIQDFLRALREIGMLAP